MGWVATRNAYWQTMNVRQARQRAADHVGKSNNHKATVSVSQPSVARVGKEQEGTGGEVYRAAVALCAVRYMSIQTLAARADVQVRCKRHPGIEGRGEEWQKMGPNKHVNVDADRQPPEH